MPRGIAEYMDKDSDPILKSLGVYGRPGTWKFRITSAFFLIRTLVGLLWCVVLMGAYVVLGLAALAVLFIIISSLSII